MGSQKYHYCTRCDDIDTECGENSETELIKFEQGITNKGEVAIWNAGYRYIKHAKNGEYWRCSTKDCSAKAKATQNKTGQFVGTLGTKEHNHLPSIQKKISEEIRNKLKHDKRPNKRPILSEVRANVSDEVYMSLGSDHALEEFLRRIFPINSALFDHSFHPIMNSTPILSDPSLQPSTLSMNTITIPRWELQLVRSPQYPVSFWNVNERALRAMAKTNNALESRRRQQVDIARSSTTFTHQRKQKYVIKEAQVMATLNEAEYDDDEQLLSVLTLLGLQMSGYVDGLRTTARPEERDSEDVVDHENEFTGQDTSSLSLII
uniref:FLYWCH-type domain-containing protein n=1 Tax=Meloidogyne floridensis TaxID=298350 RepID=A0A915P6U7_9BILA